MKLPDGWRKDRLGDLIVGNIRNGYSPVCDLSGDTCGWMLSLGALTPHGLDYSQRKTAPVDPALARVELQDNDILISRSNTPDRVGMSSIFHVQEENYFYPDLMMRFQFDSNRLLPLFGWYFLNTPEARSYFKRKASGTSSSMVKITSATVRSLEIPYPPLPEQRRVAEFLGAWDKAIEKLERLIAAKEKLHNHLINELFFSATEIMVAISDFAQEISWKSTDFLTLTVLSCTKYDGLVDSEKYFGRRVYGSDLSKYKTVPYGCFAYATNHIEEGAIGLQMQYDLALISPMYTVFRIDNKKVDPLYLFYLLKSPCYVRKFKKRTEGSVNRRGGLHWHSFSQIKVKLPNVEIQKKIAKILKYSQTELDLLSKKLAAFQKQKHGLMQKLLTGTWRV